MGNYLQFIVPIVIWVSTGTFKFLISCIRNKSITFKHVGSGGFPSNHTAIIIGTTTYIGLDHGLDEPTFLLGLAVVMIVIFDALGLRRIVGEHSVFLNKNKNAPIFSERVGHRLHEVIGGIIWGIAVAFVIRSLVSAAA